MARAWPNPPTRMVDFVFDRALIALPRVSPGTVGEKVFLRPTFDRTRLPIDVERYTRALAPGSELVLHTLQLAGGLHDAVLHRHCAVRLVVRELRGSRYKKKRHHLPDEDHARANLVANAPPHIEAQVHLLEVLVKKRGQSEDVRVEEQECNEAQVVSAIPVVELRPLGQMRGEHGPVDLVVEHREVSPVRGEKLCGHSASYSPQPTLPRGVGLRGTM